jgi:hypothetical protein
LVVLACCRELGLLAEVERPRRLVDIRVLLIQRVIVGLEGRVEVILLRYRISSCFLKFVSLLDYVQRHWVYFLLRLRYINIIIISTGRVGVVFRYR